jgi:hypothetical protein
MHRLKLKWYVTPLSDKLDDPNDPFYRDAVGNLFLFVGRQFVNDRPSTPFVVGRRWTNVKVEKSGVWVGEITAQLSEFSLKQGVQLMCVQVWGEPGVSGGRC